MAASAIPVGVGVAVEEYVAPGSLSYLAVRADIPGDELSIKIAKAQETYKSGTQALESGSYQEAVAHFTSVIETTPFEYVLCMKSLLGRRDAYKALGYSQLSSQDNRREFIWGRGFRWPGWYIIGLIMFRNEIVGE